MYPLDDVSNIDVPDFPKVLNGHDELFNSPIEPNAALCIAFTEPIKTPHKSAICIGAVPHDPILTSKDKRIRRPKLNRSGGTIANLGGHSKDDHPSNSSHQPGYGSMNILYLVACDVAVHSHGVERLVVSVE